MLKKTLKKGFITLKKQKKEKMTILGLLSGPSKGSYLGQACCNMKMANLAQKITLQIVARTFLFKKSAETLFYSVFDKQCF